MNSKARSGFKSLALVIGVLLLLFAVIGSERMNRMDDRSSQSETRRQSQDVPRAGRVKPARVEVRNSVEPAPVVSDAPAEDRPELSPQEEPVMESRRNGSGGPPARLPSQIYFIRGRALLKGAVDKESFVESIGILHRAIDQVGSTLPSGTVIFDVEGFSSSQTPVISYSKPGYDLTDQVAAVFAELRRQQEKLQEGGQAGN